jgi:hypothetical protein
MRKQTDQPLAPAIVKAAEVALHLPHRLTPLGLCLGIDQVGDRLRRGEVELVVFERPPGELAGLGRPQGLNRRQRLQHPGDDGPSAVDVKLHHILPGETRRPGKPQRQPDIDRLALIIVDANARRPSRRRINEARKPRQRRRRRRPGDPDHGDAGGPPPARGRKDRLGHDPKPAPTPLGPLPVKSRASA